VFCEDDPSGQGTKTSAGDPEGPVVGYSSVLKAHEDADACITAQ